jgi:uncharacterized protein (TIGR00730 family)
MTINSIGVFCGSSIGARDVYSQHSAELGKLMTERGIDLIFGGGKVGLMGVIADEVLKNGGKAIGIMPKMLLEKEVGHTGLTEMRVVDSMSERKNLINELSDAFIAMPGGFGTLDEVMEVLTYFQLGWSEKPVGFLNSDGYFDHLISFLDHVAEERFMKYEHRHNVIVRDNPGELLDAILNFKPLEVDEKWIADLKRRKTY